MADKTTTGGAILVTLGIGATLLYFRNKKKAKGKSKSTKTKAQSSKTKAQSSKDKAQSPKPKTQASGSAKPKTRNLKPGTSNPKPKPKSPAKGTANPKPKTTNNKQQTTNNKRPSRNTIIFSTLPEARAAKKRRKSKANIYILPDFDYYVGRHAGAMNHIRKGFPQLSGPAARPKLVR